MTNQLDPYAQWLGIAPKRRPPTHYDLLGLPQDETSAERVKRAGVERAKRVRAMATPQQKERAQRVLQELNKAVLCLADKSKREAYDQYRLFQLLEKWTESQQPPADFYELLDLHRFCPDREFLLRVVRSARQQLEDGLHDEGTRSQLARLVRQLEAAEQALSDVDACRGYHKPVLTRLKRGYARQHGRDPGAWDVKLLSRWLEHYGRVHPSCSGAVVRALKSTQPGEEDRLLERLYPGPKKPEPEPGPDRLPVSPKGPSEAAPAPPGARAGSPQTSVPARVKASSGKAPPPLPPLPLPEGSVSGPVGGFVPSRPAPSL